MQVWTTAALALYLTGCSSVMFPGPRAYQRDRDQACVEHALRHDPDAASLLAADERFAKACDAGDPAGCSTLGVMTELGLGRRTRDEAEAADLYRRACEGGNVPGCTHLAVALRHGTGVDADIDAAQQLLTKACEHHDHGPACTELGEVEVVSEGSVSQRLRGVGRMQLSCSTGSGDACYRLAQLFDLGVIGPDPTRAVELFETACRLGESAGCERLDAIWSRSRLRDDPAVQAEGVASKR